MSKEQAEEQEGQEMNQSLQVRENPVLPMSAKDVVGQIALIQDMMRAAMQEGEHYGVIPGCGDKPSLLKPGAEKLALTFRLAPDYTVTRTDLPGGHREYEVLTRMTHISTGTFLGAGVGAASTMETKWRFRNTWTDTGGDIPQDYKENKGAYRAKGFGCRKDDETGEWKWCKLERVEHDNPADYYNTVLKMAKKRSQIDATLTVTAASDIFTQDVEELRENGVLGEDATREDKPQGREPIREPKPQETILLETTAERKARINTEPTPQPKQTAKPNTFHDQLTLGEVKAKSGKSAKGAWTRWYAKGDDGEYYSTFDKKIGEAMESCQGELADIIYKVETTAKGESRVVLSIGPVREERASKENEPSAEQGDDAMPF